MYEVRGKAKGKFQNLGFLEGKKYQVVFDNKERASKEVADRIKSNSWLKQSDFEIREFKVDKRSKKYALRK